MIWCSHTHCKSDIDKWTGVGTQEEDRQQEKTCDQSLDSGFFLMLRQDHQTVEMQRTYIIKYIIFILKQLTLTETLYNIL